VARELAAALDDWAADRKRRRRPAAEWARLLEVARRADPDPWRDRLRAAVRGGTLLDLQLLYAEAFGRQAELPAASVQLLGVALAAAGDPDTAADWLRPAALRRPGDVWLNYHLAEALKGQRPPRLPEALRHYAAARAVRPEVGHALAHALEDAGDRAGAVTLFRELTRLRPDNPRHHSCLGSALQAQGDLAGAEASSREALRLDPKFASAHNNLGLALQAQGDLAGAVASYREAIRLDPKFAEAHCNLGSVLRLQGRFTESLAALRRGHELGSRDPKWRYPSVQWVQQAQRYVEREPLLDAIRIGQASPTDSVEFVLFAQMSQCTGHSAAAARLYGEAFALWPQLRNSANSYRYDGACSAALAGCGRGKGADSLGEAERAAWRRQALEWLRADLVAWDRLAFLNPAAVRQMMQHWQKDVAFAGVRDQEALAKLPEAERAAWQKLWAEVEALLQDTQEERFPVRGKMSPLPDLKPLPKSMPSPPEKRP
jgi:tetratricopeptide (TPR) repeat protein